MCFTAEDVQPAACGFHTGSQTEAMYSASLRDIRSWLQEQALTSGWSYPFHFLILDALLLPALLVFPLLRQDV